MHKLHREKETQISNYFNTFLQFITNTGDWWYRAADTKLMCKHVQNVAMVMSQWHLYLKLFEKHIQIHNGKQIGKMVPIVMKPAQQRV